MSRVDVNPPRGMGERKVDTSTAVTPIVLTFDQVGKEAKCDDPSDKKKVAELFKQVSSVEEAFAKFLPNLEYKSSDGKVVIQKQFRFLSDFKEENLLKNQPGTRNDLADLEI